MTLAAGDGKPLKLDGLPNSQAQQLKRSLSAVIEAKREREQIEALCSDFDRQVRPILRWALSTFDACKRQITARGWLSHDFVQRVGASKPVLPSALFHAPEVQQHLARQPQAVQDAVRTWQRPLEQFAQGVNQRHAAKVATTDRAFFDRVERSPLTREQREAVVCFESRVLLVAFAWDSQKRRSGFWTLNGEIVKSQGEELLANWLFYNGIRYVYEAPYEHDTADATPSAVST